MTDVVMNVENIIDDYEDKTQGENLKIELFLATYKIKKLLKTQVIKKLMKKYIVRNKTINSGEPTIKGTRITPDDIGRLVANEKNITIEKILEEYPSLENKEQVIAGLFAFVKQNITWRKILIGR